MRFKIYISVFMAGLALLVGTASAATSAVERVASEGKVEASCDFEGESIPSMMRSAWGGAPISMQKGEGALGSSGFLRVGPHSFYYVGAALNVPFVVKEDTWLGFSARKEGGGGLYLMFATPNGNVNAGAGLPADGSWKTFRIEVSKRGMNPGTPVNGISFGVDNNAHAPVIFDLDNIRLGHGKPDQVPSAPAAVKAQTTNAVAVVTWQTPGSFGGLLEYRVYRGYHPDFARDERHLVGRTGQNLFSDNVFPRPTTYYYAVRAVDFAGNESKDSGAVFINLSGEK